jgi:hypothetical protein
MYKLPSNTKAIFNPSGAKNAEVSGAGVNVDGGEVVSLAGVLPAAVAVPRYLVGRGRAVVGTGARVSVPPAGGTGVTGLQEDRSNTPKMTAIGFTFHNVRAFRVEVGNRVGQQRMSELLSNRSGTRWHM